MNLGDRLPAFVLRDAANKEWSSQGRGGRGLYLIFHRHLA
jgi:hypothetical protein